MLVWLREQIDKILLSDHEWKKKYCPYLYHYLFEMTDKERHELLFSEQGMHNSDVAYIDMLRTAGHSDEDIVWHMKNARGRALDEEATTRILNVELPYLYKCWKQNAYQEE